MSLTLALNNALTGLNVNQKSLAVLSQNIANANTKGYSKQNLNQDAVYIDGNGSGVSIQEITRKVDAYLQKAVAGQSSVVGASSVSSDYASRIQLLLGNPGSQNSIPNYLTSFFNSLQSMAQTPEDATAQQNVVNTAISLTTQTQSLAKGLQGLQFQADQDINIAVNNINSDLANLKQLNHDISNAALLGQSIAGLQDKQDALVNDLSQYLPIQVTQRQYGAINITVGNGISLLDDNGYQLSYSPAISQDSFSNNPTLSPIIVQRLDDAGHIAAGQQPATLVTGGKSSEVTSSLTTGSLQALLDMRDHQLPGLTGQLDTMTAAIRDQVNAITNSGSNYPGAASLTGNRLVNAQDYSRWTGSARVAVLQPNGQPLPSPYNDEPNGLPPLTLDFARMDTGMGAGNPSVQGIINAINQYYGAPQPKVELGNLNNIQLVSDTAALPTSNPPSFSFDFNLNNISDKSSNFYLTNVSVQDSSGTNITSTTSTIPSLALSSGSTYKTTSGSNVVTLTTSGTNTLANGDVVYLSTPPGAVDGIPASSLGGYFTVSNVTGNTFQITATSGTASAGGTFGVANQTALPPYESAVAGQQTRTSANGKVTADLSGNPTSPYYTITATVGVDDGSGNIQTAQVSYRINNNLSNLLNTPYSVYSASGSARVVQPTTSQPYARAMLVDANGVELPMVNGSYTNTQNGYLKIQTVDGSSVVALDSMDSAEQGRPNNSPAIPGTGRGFSYYFNMNDFFTGGSLPGNGTGIPGSALNFQVTNRLKATPNLIPTGKLVQTPAITGVNYTYQMNSGDNSIVQKLAALASNVIDFQASGQLGASQQTFTSYASNIIGAASTNAAAAKSNSDNAQTLFNGYQQQASSVSGVNLDSELANTIIYQNAYSASARVITVTNDFFSTLLQAFQ